MSIEPSAIFQPCAAPPSTFINLGEVESHRHAYCGPRAPVLAAFGGGPMHTYSIHAESEYDLIRVADDHAAALVISKASHECDGDESIIDLDELLFAFGPRRFLRVEDDNLTAYAETRALAKEFALEFANKYRKPPEPDSGGGSFEIIRVDGSNFGTETVTLDRETILTDETLDLHYGSGFAAWHRHFVSHLPSRGCGLSIFQGPPGTGKTSYLRHLMGALRKTHRFYYIQPIHMHILSSPEFVRFWVKERRANDEQKLVVILEDAEEAIMRRAGDNSAHVSAILNLSDGLLGDFIRLHIICTMNCAMTDIDPALLRPGRLNVHRKFTPLDRAAANRLGKQLPNPGEYSLAEIFAGQASEQTNRELIGFTRAGNLSRGH